MSGDSQQDKKKAERRSVDMSRVRESEAARYHPPPVEECEDQGPYDSSLDGGDRERLRVRMVVHVETGRTVSFAMIQQTLYRSRWRDVYVIDCAHDECVHAHQYGRSKDGRIGRRKELHQIAEQSDIEDGYRMALDDLMKNWAQYKTRWHDG